MKQAARRLGRRLQAIALGVIEPPVIRAGEAPLLDAAVEEGCAPMRAVVGEQTHVAALVFEEDQILPQHADVLRRRRVGNVREHSHRLPVAAKQLAAWGPRAYSG